MRIITKITNHQTKKLRPKTKFDKGFCRTWLKDNFHYVEDYIFDTYTPEDVEHFVKLMFSNPIHAYYWVLDYKKTNDEKVKDFEEKLMNEAVSNCIIIAYTGFGKTVMALTLLKKLKKKYGIRIYQLCSEIPSDIFDGVVYDIRNVPKKSWVYVDECANVWQSRDFKSERNMKISRELTVFRHNDLKFIGCTQKARLVDLNVIDFCNFKVVKYLVNREYERENILNEFTDKLVPTDRDNKSSCMLLFENQVSTFDYYPNQEFMTKRVSKNQSFKLTLEQLQNKAYMLFEANYSINEISKILDKENKAYIDLNFLKKDLKKVP